MTLAAYAFLLAGAPKFSIILLVLAWLTISVSIFRHNFFDRKSKHLQVIGSASISLCIAILLFLAWIFLRPESASTPAGTEVSKASQAAADTPAPLSAPTPTAPNSNKQSPAIEKRNHSQPAIEKPPSVDTSSNPKNYRFNYVRILQSNDNYAEIEVSYYYNSVDKNDIEITLGLLGEDGSPFGYGLINKIEVAGDNAITRFNYSYSGTGEKSTEAEVCMKRSASFNPFHCQRFPLNKTWKPYKPPSD